MIQTQDMYCHNTGCESFNQPQSFAYRDDTYDAPGYWLEDPECRDCDGVMHNERIDTEFRVGDLLAGIAEEGDGYHGTEKADLVYQFVIEWVKENHK